MCLSQGISPKISVFKVDTHTQVNIPSDSNSNHQMLDVGSRGHQLQTEQIILGVFSLSQLSYT